MHSNGVDTRRLSPQTTSSSGYHSDLSSTNESPKSIHENTPTNIEQYTVCHIRKKTNNDTSLKIKSLSRISSFIRKQYERAKLKLTPEKPHPPLIKTSSKATSTTPLSYSLENPLSKPQQFSSSTYKYSSYVEPVKRKFLSLTSLFSSKVHSVYVHPLYDNTLKRIPSKTYTSIHECYSQQPSHRLSSYSKINNNQINSHSIRRSAVMINFENPITKCCLSTNLNTRRHQYYSSKPTYSQNYYPYKYINKNYDYNRSIYSPLSDFVSTKKSAFKPIKVSQHPRCHIPEEIPPSEDPCDLEVAQYFHQTPQWSNPNYFDIYTKQARKNYTETLC
jgi:hypothetical protein